jgi:hypothetical protein
MESAASGGFAASILRITALYFLGMRRLDSESPQHPPFLPSSSSSDDDLAGVPGGESPCCSRSRYSSLYCSRHSRRLSLLSFARAARSCSLRCAARVADRAWGVGGSDRAACTVTLC